MPRDGPRTQQTETGAQESIDDFLEKETQLLEELYADSSYQGGKDTHEA